MQYAAKLSPRAVMSSGKGSSSAGLTVTAIKDGGHWALEAGALVLADGQSSAHIQWLYVAIVNIFAGHSADSTCFSLFHRSHSTML